MTLITFGLAALLVQPMTPLLVAEVRLVVALPECDPRIDDPCCPLYSGEFIGARDDYVDCVDRLWSPSDPMEWV